MAELLKIYTARKEQLLHEGSGILGKYVEVADLRKGIIGILKRHMEKLGGKLRFEELSYKGMPYLDEYSKFWDSPMDAVEEAWKELVSEKHMIDRRSIFSVGRNSEQPYSVAKETEAKKVNGRPHVEMKKVEVNSMGNRQTISAERKAFLVTELCRMVEENGGFFPKEANDVSRLSGLKYGELLKAFRSYDGIKSAAMNEWSKNGKRITKVADEAEIIDATEADEVEVIDATEAIDAKVVEAERPAKKRRGSSNKIPDDEIKQALRKFYETHGRLPLQLECGRANGLPSWNTLLLHFGPRNNWEGQLGIEEETKPLKVEKTEVMVEPEAEPVVEAESETKPEDEPMVEVEPEVESEDEPMAEAEQPKVIAHELYSDGLEVQIVVRLPGQEKPLKITISQ